MNIKIILAKKETIEETVKEIARAIRQEFNFLYEKLNDRYDWIILENKNDIQILQILDERYWDDSSNYLHDTGWYKAGKISAFCGNNLITLYVYYREYQLNRRFKFKNEGDAK